MTKNISTILAVREGAAGGGGGGVGKYVICFIHFLESYNFVTSVFLSSVNSGNRLRTYF